MVLYLNEYSGADYSRRRIFFFRSGARRKCARHIVEAVVPSNLCAQLHMLLIRIYARVDLELLIESDCTFNWKRYTSSEGDN